MEYSKLFDLSEEVILLLGFTGPIGRQFSSVFAESGCTLILGDINENAGIKRAEKLKETNSTIEFIRIDVSIENEIVKIVKHVEEKHGRLSVLVNNYSTQPPGFNKKFEESDLGNWCRVLEVNLSGMYLACREASKLMMKQRYGSIINVSSILGVLAPDQRIYGNSGLNAPASYTASKSGVIGLTKYLAAYLGKDNIRVNCISPAGVNPGDVNEEFVRNYSYKIPLGRMANMDDLKGSAVFLASRASEYVTGHNLVVDGGLNIW